MATDRLARSQMASLVDPMTADDSSKPLWWQKAVALEQSNRLEEAERAITEAVQHIGAAASVAELYRLRMVRLIETGDVEGARAAADQAERWITFYASQATSGGEGVALSQERDQFLAELGRGPLRRAPHHLTDAD